jgi:hypothetical protein
MEEAISEQGRLLHRNYEFDLSQTKRAGAKLGRVRYRFIALSAGRQMSLSLPLSQPESPLESSLTP